MRVSLAGFLFVNVCLSPLLIVVASTSWHGLWVRGLIPRTVLLYVRAGSVSFSVATARYDMRLWSQKRTGWAGALPGSVGPCSVRFVFFPSQSVFEFPPLSRE